MRLIIKSLSWSLLCVAITHTYCCSQADDAPIVSDGTYLSEKLRLLCRELVCEMAQEKDQADVMNVLCDMLKHYQEKIADQDCCNRAAMYAKQLLRKKYLKGNNDAVCAKDACNNSQSLSYCEKGDRG